MKTAYELAKISGATPRNRRRKRAILALGRSMPPIATRKGDTLHLALNGIVGDPGRGKGFSALQVEAALLCHPHVDFIDVEINSIGGSPREALAIHAVLKNHPAFVITRGNEACVSAATVILAAGNHREAYPGTRLLLHRAEAPPLIKERWTAAEHKRMAAHLERVDRSILNVYAECGAHVQLFEREMQSETYLPLGIAKSWGLINCLAGEARWIAGRPYTQ